MSERIFVLVVCGAREHIDTLHYSLKSLRRFSQHKMVVITDSSRNEIPIQHTWIIDVKTPEEFNHHQASIFLKTGIYQFLPQGNLYCYLDTDVVAISHRVDDIFNQYIEPITFAADHCRINQFSQYAVNCGCHEKSLVTKEKLETSILKYNSYLERKDALIEEKSNELQKVLERKTSIWMKAITIVRYYSSYPIFQLDTDFYFDKKRQNWYYKTGQVIRHHFEYKKVEKETGLKYDKQNGQWRTEDGVEVWYPCNHLKNAIRDKFGVNITDDKWQHWNGGVFLFDDKSHGFLSLWHQLTLETFKDAYWKTRDQGSLIATVWKLNVQQQPLLDSIYNCIIDYNDSNCIYLQDLRFQIKDSIVEPFFLHIFYHFGDKKWDIWRDIETRTGYEY